MEVEASKRMGPTQSSGVPARPRGTDFFIASMRSGGVAEITKIAEAAFRRGLLCIPHCWNHMVGVAAAVYGLYLAYTALPSAWAAYAGARR